MQTVDLQKNPRPPFLFRWLPFNSCSSSDSVTPQDLLIYSVQEYDKREEGNPFLTWMASKPVQQPKNLPGLLEKEESPLPIGHCVAANDSGENSKNQNMGFTSSPGEGEKGVHFYVGNMECLSKKGTEKCEDGDASARMLCPSNWSVKCWEEGQDKCKCFCERNETSRTIPIAK